MRSSGYVWGRSAFDSSEDLDQCHCLEVEIWKEPKKCEFWFNFHCFGFVSIGVVGYMRVSKSVIPLFMFHNNFSFLGNVSRFPF